MSEPYLISDVAPLLLPLEDGFEGGVIEVPPFKPRSKGVHVSTIIRDLMVEMGAFDRDREPNTALWDLGNSLEFSIISRLRLQDPERYVQPGELTFEGYYLTPDLLDLEGDEEFGRGRVDEIKFTSMSVNNDPAGEKYWRYWLQVSIYCLRLGTNKAGLRIYHHRGDYKGAQEPQYRHWGRDFDLSEMQSNWETLKRHAKKMREKGLL